jgi:glycine/sarcosine N-methyltransferase
MSDDVRDFYQQLAAEYHLVYSDWHQAIERQSTALDRLIRASGDGPPLDMLDCSCGIGTQAIGLAARGYTVHATDFSPAAVQRAAREAASQGVTLTTGVADMRALARQVAGDFDIVLSCDNAVPHLLTDDDLLLAAQNMRAKLRDSGLLLISIRDYDHLLLSKPRATQPQVIDARADGAPDGETGRRIVFQVWDWQDTQYTLTLFILRQRADLSGEWFTSTYRTSYRALQRTELNAILERAGFTALRWHMPQDTGYYQPVVIARPA